MKKPGPVNPFAAAFLRACSHALLAAFFVCIIWWVLTAAGVPEALAVGIGLAFALAPGAYDYLGQDLLGRRIDEPDPLESNDPFLKFREGKYSRRRDEGLNASDFVFIARLLKPKYQPLAALIAELDLPQWRKLNPDSDLVEAVMESLSDEIDETPHWARDKKLPLYPLFLLDLLECLH